MLPDLLGPFRGLWAQTPVQLIQDLHLVEFVSRGMLRDPSVCFADYASNRPPKLPTLELDYGNFNPASLAEPWGVRGLAPQKVDYLVWRIERVCV